MPFDRHALNSARSGGRRSLVATACAVRIVAVLVLFTAAASGCRDSAAPLPELDVALVLNLMGPATIDIGDDASTTVECSISLEATVSGTGAASWDGGSIRFYAGRDRSQPLDTLPLSASAVEQIWGGRQIAPGETHHAQMSFGGDLPFGVTLAFRHRSSIGSVLKTEEASFLCGPEVPPNSAPPTINPLIVQPSSGTIQWGGPLSIEFTAESEAGLLRTELTLSGGCEYRDANAELLEKATTRTVVIGMPRSCRTDRPIIVTVTAFDAAFEVVSRELTLTLTLIDTTPPRIMPYFFPQSSATPAGLAGGVYFVGDSIALIPNASDNHAVAAIVWDVLPTGVRDSVVDMSSWTSYHMRIPIREDWGLGPIQLRLYARDSAGLTSNIHTSEPNAIQLYPVISRPTRSAEVLGHIADFAIDSRREVVYLLQPYERRIAVLSLATMTVSHLIPLPAVPADLDITPQGDSLVVTLPLSRALGVIDLRDGSSPVKVVPLTILDETVQQAPKSIRILGSGKAFVSLEGSEHRAHQLAEVNLITTAQRMRLDAGDGGYVGNGMLERSHDGSALVIQGGGGLFQRYDVSTDAFGPRRTATPHYWRPSVDAQGNHAAIGLDVFDETLLPLRRMNMIISGFAPTALSANGEHLYVAWAKHGIVRARVSDGAIQDRTPNPITPELIKASADGALIVTVEPRHTGASRISVIDMRQGTVAGPASHVRSSRFD